MDAILVVANGYIKIHCPFKQLFINKNWFLCFDIHFFYQTGSDLSKLQTESLRNVPDCRTTTGTYRGTRQLTDTPFLTLKSALGGGSRISGKGVQMCNGGDGGWGLLILAHFSLISNENEIIWPQ